MTGIHLYLVSQQLFVVASLLVHIEGKSGIGGMFSSSISLSVSSNGNSVLPPGEVVIDIFFFEILIRCFQQWDLVDALASNRVSYAPTIARENSRLAHIKSIVIHQSFAILLYAARIVANFPIRRDAWRFNKFLSLSSVLCFYFIPVRITVSGRRKYKKPRSSPFHFVHLLLTHC